MKGDDLISKKLFLENQENVDDLPPCDSKDIFSEEMYFKYAWSKFPSNVLAERDDPFIRFLLSDAEKNQEPI